MAICRIQPLGYSEMCLVCLTVQLPALTCCMSGFPHDLCNRCETVICDLCNRCNRWETVSCDLCNRCNRWETVSCDLCNRWETVSCDLCNRCETIRSFSAQNVRKSICRKGFQAVCAPMGSADDAVHSVKTWSVPAYIQGIYIYYLTIYGGGYPNVRESSRVTSSHA